MRKSLFLVVTLLLASSLACSFSAPRLNGLPSPTPPVVQVAPPTSVPVVGADPTLPPPPQTLLTDSEEQALIELYQRVNLSVVAILVNADIPGAGSQGSGFVYDTEGHIVTNFHVVDGAQDIEVDFASGFRARARVVGTDADSDLAVIKVDAPVEQLSPIPLGDSDQLKVGQRVIAIGNPFGLEGTMTLGIISSLGRTLDSLRTAEGVGQFVAPDIIQTDAAINPGNSGGPLINLQGEVVGVNKAIESETGSNTGIGFAIASNTVRQVVPYLITDGKFVYPYLGMSSQELSLADQERFEFPQTGGAYVTSVVLDGPSARAGLRGDSAVSDTSATRYTGDGDFIIAVDGQPVRLFADLISYLINHTRPGQTVTLTVLRDGEQRQVEVVLGERP